MLDCAMNQALLVIDVQPAFSVPPGIVAEITLLAAHLPSVATIERYDESITPFARQLGWTPPAREESLVAANRNFIKHGYLLPRAVVDHLRALAVDRVLVCGVQAETCVLAAGFALFDAGLSPTLLAWLTVGSSLDPSGGLGARLWRHHFGAVLSRREELALD
jgi:nicotinamidase-related amidase